MAYRLINDITVSQLSRCLARVLVAGTLLATSAHLAAADSAGDCTEIDLRYETLDAPLTDAEIAELRARRHAESLNAFERCITEASRGAGDGNGSGSGNGTGAGQGSGVAASGISGTNPLPPVAEPPPPSEQQPTEVASETTSSQESNGRAPIDIPPADNDSVLAAQIRQAAETETDPERRAKLWNEYRKIKGLPTKDS